MSPKKKAQQQPTAAAPKKSRKIAGHLARKLGLVRDHRASTDWANDPRPLREKIEEDRMRRAHKAWEQRAKEKELERLDQKEKLARRVIFQRAKQESRALRRDAAAAPTIRAKRVADGNRARAIVANARENYALKTRVVPPVEPKKARLRPATATERPAALMPKPEAVKAPSSAPKRQTGEQAAQTSRAQTRSSGKGLGR